MQLSLFSGKMEKARIGNVRVNNITFVWAMVFLGIVIYAVAWFALGLASMMIIDALVAAFSGMLTLSSDALQVISLLRWVILLHPIFAMFGWLLWGFLNSAKRDVSRYEV